VVFSPKSAGENTHCIRLSNINDPTNTIDLTISTSVAVTARQEHFSAFPLSLDFGACYIGRSYKQVVSLKNLSEEPVELVRALV
jgi:hypothetical protein